MGVTLSLGDGWPPVEALALDIPGTEPPYSDVNPGKS